MKVFINLKFRAKFRLKFRVTFSVKFIFKTQIEISDSLNVKNLIDFISNFFLQDELQQLDERDLLGEGEQRRQHGRDLLGHLMVVRVLPTDGNRNCRTHRKHIGHPDSFVGKVIHKSFCRH